MTAENERTFLRIVRKIPDPEQAIRSYELTQLLKDFEKTRQEQIRVLGEEEQAQLEHSLGKEVVQEIFDRVRRGEPIV